TERRAPRPHRRAAAGGRFKLVQEVIPLPAALDGCRESERDERREAEEERAGGHGWTPWRRRDDALSSAATAHAATLRQCSRVPESRERARRGSGSRALELAPRPELLLA